MVQKQSLGILSYFRLSPCLEVVKLLVKAGADINHIPEDEHSHPQSAFHWACRYYPESIPYFLECDADVNRIAEHDQWATPLSLAIGSGKSNLATADALIAAGARITGSDGLRAFVAGVVSDHQDLSRLDWLVRKVNYKGSLKGPIEIQRGGHLNRKRDDYYPLLEKGTLLHAAACGARLETIHHLTSMRLKGLVDIIDQEDAVGYTARDYLWFRTHPVEDEDDDGSSVEEINVERYGEDDEDDQDYEPSETESEGTTNESDDSEPDSNDDTNTTSSSGENEDMRLIDAFEAFLRSLEPGNGNLNSRVDDEQDEFFDALEE